MSAFEATAHAWLTAGWGPLPLPARKKSPPPKHWTGAGAAYPSGADVQAWIEEPEYADGNLALRFPANIIGIDVDEYEGKHGRATLVDHTKKWGQLPPTFRITSRKGTISGIYLYRLPAVASSAHFIGELPGGNVEILRKEHRYAVGPGSTHPDGRTYELVTPDGQFGTTDMAITADELPELPAAWIDGLTVQRIEREAQPDVELAAGRGNRYVEKVIAAIQGELHAIADWPVGKTDERGRGWEKIQADAAFRIASLALADWNDLTIELAGRAFATAAPRGGGWDDADVAAKWRSQLNRAEPAEPPATSDDPLDPGYVAPDTPDVSGFEAAAGDGGKPVAKAVAEIESTGDVVRGSQAVDEWTKRSWDDHGNSERVIARAGGQLRYIESMDRWMHYDEARGTWVESKFGCERATMQVIDELPKIEAHLYSAIERKKGDKTTSDRKEFLEWVATQRYAARYKSAAQVVKFSGALDESVRVFDNKPTLLNVKNGVIDLMTGELRAHEPNLLLRRQVPVEYDPNAKAPRWEAWLNQMMPDPEMRAYLQRVFGYSITGLTGEQVVFIHHGPPATGKSVFLRIIEALMGELARVVPPTTLLTKKQENHPTDIMGLEGRRVLQVSETAEGARLDEALVKRLSGEETLTARGMGQDFRDFRLTGKVHLVTNHLPHISDDEATRRRIHLIQWMTTIPEEERIQGLADELIRDELPGILAWAVEGTLQWRKQKLNRPAGAHLAALDYFEEEDEFGLFLEAKLVATDVVWTANTSLYRYYSQWCSSTNVKPMSQIAFSRKMVKRGFRKFHNGRERGFYCALRNDPIVASPNADPLEM